MSESRINDWERERQEELWLRRDEELDDESQLASMSEEDVVWSPAGSAETSITTLVSDETHVWLVEPSPLPAVPAGTAQAISTSGPDATADVINSSRATSDASTGLSARLNAWLDRQVEYSRRAFAEELEEVPPDPTPSSSEMGWALFALVMLAGTTFVAVALASNWDEWLEVLR
jgi:hypothetical protein